MFKNRLFKNVLFSWMPHKEQSICEKKLEKVIKRLKIENFHFNWDRSSCFVEFNYQGKSYRLDHSVEKAKERGIILRNGLDCMNDLTQSLEDLCQIIDRGTYKFETWIAGMQHSPAVRETQPEYQEEFHIKYKTTGKQTHHPQPEYKKEEEFNPFGPQPALRDYEKQEEEIQPQRR
ncbi:hypothetical protein [Halobacillus mangrovi]|uniref:Uncharacterized protein n=1 Tax=Halobacillus mangrovi TaxID=402384 RepID=A0A1W5ZY93_9BACI|nr:hypothetical protein [Halobacillus mangrovi]ARI78308.1 hypothetical protein HM131_16335 [Halobacillus mangrovi]